VTQKFSGERNVVLLIGFRMLGAVVEKLRNYIDITTPLSIFPHLPSNPKNDSPEAQTQGGTLRAGSSMVYLLLVWES
jgi:hypothetical protein